MLVQITVRNYKTFKDSTTLNLLASNYDKETREEDNVTLDTDFNLRILKSSIVYGANASGKSKFVDALEFMRDFAIESSIYSQKGDPIEVEPFKLEQESAIASSEFEVIFIHNGEMFRYGFEVNQEKVIAEWLFTKPKTKEVEVFYRTEQDIEAHSKLFPRA